MDIKKIAKEVVVSNIGVSEEFTNFTNAYENIVKQTEALHKRFDGDMNSHTEGLLKQIDTDLRELKEDWRRFAKEFYYNY